MGSLPGGSWGPHNAAEAETQVGEEIDDRECQSRSETGCWASGRAMSATDVCSFDLNCWPG